MLSLLVSVVRDVNRCKTLRTRVENAMKEIEMTRRMVCSNGGRFEEYVAIIGSENRDVVFLFGDAQIKDEAFIEDINNLLNAGEIPNAFPMDEKAQV